jgi:hypothetical protein
MGVFLKIVLRFGLAILTAYISGCVATQEGPAIVGDAKARAGSHHLYRCYKGKKANPSKYHEKCNKQLLMVGTVSAFREFDEAEYLAFYRKYLELANLVHPGEESSVSLEAFRQEFAGWTMLKWKYLPLGSLYDDALVPKKLRWHIDFPSSTATVLYQGEGDLLLARSNPDGFFVVESVLCSGKSGLCGYQQGIFDANTGSELDHNLDPKSGGKRFAIESYNPP